jgi:WD40 repeat protein
MHCHNRLILVGMIILSCLLVPVVSAVDPLWTVPATTSGELSTVVISADGSTIIAGGDQLIALTRDGTKLWTGWSGSRLVISQDGNYILTARDQNARMISGTGTMLWDQWLEVPVTDLSMTPNASLIAAGGANRLRLISPSGSGIRQNVTMPVMNHFRLFPDGEQIVITSTKGIHTSNLTFFSEWTDANVTQDYVEVAADGSSFVTVTNNRIRFYTRDGQLMWERALPGGNALGFACSRDGSTIVVGRDDNTLSVLDRDGTLLWTAPAAYWVTSVAVSDDGNTIVAGSMDKTISVYDRAGTKLGSAMAKNQIKSGSVAVSGDGSVIAAVDGSAVYGFSRSQFIQPVTPVMTTTPAVTTPAPATTPVTPMHTAATTPATTPKAALIPAVPFGVLVLFLVWRSRKS